LEGYESIRNEVRYGKNSRIDILLEGPARPPCYVEIKNVTLSRRPGHAEFPDAATARGLKHLDELAAMARSGARAVMFYLVQRGDAKNFAIASDIDPAYHAAWINARAAGVETMAWSCHITPHEIELDRALPVAAPPQNG
ncbi:MAG TPA: DNA/RNA nuclease SfsA, partial [Rhizobiales bacterium]|nr:DNA/RNA nuclease SfsA [Hyphomicrobiales bacterium]